LILLPSVKSNDFRADFLAAIHSAHRFRARGRIGGSAGELGCLGKLLSCRVIDNDSRVPLDKSEGVVKTEISWAVREHRFFAREG